MPPRRTTLRGAFLLLSYTISALLSLSPQPSYAQYKPELTVQSGNGFLEGRALYILSGGTVAGMISGQCFMVDLSVSWTTAAPVYKTLTVGPGANLFPSSMTADGQKWFVMVKGTGSFYDIASGRWTQFFAYPGASKNYGRAAATDPVTGKIYIPFQYLKPDGSYGMLIVDPKDGSINTDTWDFKGPDQSTYAVTWNAVLQSLLYSGGNTMYSYSETGGWQNFNAPTGIQTSHSSCMVSSTTGSKVVFFGGYSEGLNATVGDIFILDVATVTWKKGPSTPARDVRRAPACAISNDQFIVWGGDTGNTPTIVPPENIMLVYSLQTDTWINSYTAPAAPPGLSTSLVPSRTGTVPSTPSGTVQPSVGEASSSHNNTGIIIGAVGGGIALGLLLGGVFMYRARMAQSKSRESLKDRLAEPPSPKGSSGDIPTAIPHDSSRSSLVSDPNLVTRPFIQPCNPSAIPPYRYPAPTNIVYVNAPHYDPRQRRTVQEGTSGSPHMSENPHGYCDPISTPESGSTYQMYYLAGPEVQNRHGY